MNSNCEKHTINMGCCEPVMVWADASDYYTKQEVNQKLVSLDAKNLDVEDFDAYSASTKDTIDAVSGDVISEHDRAVAAENALNGEIVSATSGMATEQWVESQGYLTEHQSLSGYATEQWVLDKNYITGVDLSNYALKSEIPTVPTSNTAFTNDAGYITSTALNGYATEAYVSGYTYDKTTVDNKLADKLDVTAYTPTDLSNYYTKNETSSKTEIADAISQSTSGSVTSAEVQTQIDNSISGKTNQSDFSAHTANTNIHVTTAQTSAWDAKSDFSGSYNDLTDKPTIPTVPTSNTAFTNDAGYITNDALSGYAESTAVTAEISAAVSGKTNESDFSAHTANTSIHVTTAQTASWDAKQNALTAGSGISITNNVISVTGGTEGITSAQCQAQIDQSISGKTNQSDFSAHTANTTVHITSTERNTWNAKADVWVGDETAWSQISGNTQQGVIYLVY